MPDPRDRDRYDDHGHGPRDGRLPAAGDDLRPECVEYDLGDLERLWSRDVHVPQSPPYGMRPVVRTGEQDDPDILDGLDRPETARRPGSPPRPAGTRPDDDGQPGDDPRPGRPGPQRRDAAHLVQAGGAVTRHPCRHALLVRASRLTRSSVHPPPDPER